MIPIAASRLHENAQYWKKMFSQLAYVIWSTIIYRVAMIAGSDILDTIAGKTGYPNKPSLSPLLLHQPLVQEAPREQFKNWGEGYVRYIN